MHGVRSADTSHSKGVWINVVNLGEVCGGNVGAIGRGAQSPEQHIGVVIHVGHSLCHLHHRPVIGHNPSHSDAWFQLPCLCTSLVVVSLHHTASEVNLSSLSEGDLVELGPAVKVVTVPSVLSSKLFLARSILDIGASQPVGKRIAALPAQGNFVKL